MEQQQHRLPVTYKYEEYGMIEAVTFYNDTELGISAKILASIVEDVELRCTL